MARAIWDGNISFGLINIPIELCSLERNKRIYVDYLRNSKGATSILNYSTRARPNAPVATPLFWDEVHEDLDPGAFTLKTIPARLRSLKSDPWANLTF